MNGLLSMRATALKLNHWMLVLLGVSVTLLLHAAFASARGQEVAAYPSRPVHIIVPSAAGGTTDIVARVIAQALTRSLGVTFIVEQKVGGNTNIGSAFVSKAAPDGYTLLVNTDTLTSNASMYKNPGYDVVTGFAPVSMLTVASGALAVRKNLEVANLTDFVELARKQGKALSMASTGNGTVSHLTSLMFRQRIGLSEWTEVPYQGSAKVVTDLVGGHVDAAVAMIAPFVQPAQSGDMRLLAVTTKARSPAAPDVPTIAESTQLKDFDVANWTAMLAPPGTPEPIVAKLAAAVEAALKDAEVLKAFSALGLAPADAGPKALAQSLRDNIAQWRAVVDRARLSPI